MRALRHGSAEGGSAAAREAALGQATARLDAVQPGAAGLLGEALRDEPMLSHVIDGLRGPRLVSAMRAGMDRAGSSPSMRTGRRMEAWAAALDQQHWGRRVGSPEMEDAGDRALAAIVAVFRRDPAALDHLCATAERHGLGEGQSRNQMLGQLARDGLEIEQKILVKSRGEYGAQPPSRPATLTPESREERAGPPPGKPAGPAPVVRGSPAARRCRDAARRVRTCR